ncbi:uncharacterized protein BDW70DRAFT_165283 [Aspergillus foveolatus]|uniref:uncharacterized protein n=1 Tax=Aspergillus foveolatus TaxID=210207 RepID=UPI003CCCEF5A
MAISSNQRRATAKQECRQKLADCLKTQLGLDVPPEKVRLRPRRDDKYQWKVAEPLRGLFATKDLSNGTIGDFHKISTALERGKIEAVFTNEEVLLCENNHRPLIPLDEDNLEALERERQSKLEFEKYREEMQEAELRWQEERQDLINQVLQCKAERDQYQQRLYNMGQMISPILNSLTQYLSDEKS